MSLNSRDIWKTPKYGKRSTSELHTFPFLEKRKRSLPAFPSLARSRRECSVQLLNERLDIVFVVGVVGVNSGMAN